MTDTAQRIARANRAQLAWDEFMAPMLNDLRVEYTARMVDVANAELNRDKRADKLTALSNALRIIEVLQGGMLATIRDGDVAHADKLRAETLENMTVPQRRLRNLIPG